VLTAVKEWPVEGYGVERLKGAFTRVIAGYAKPIVDA
jgi:hypothetical protein